MNGLEFTAGGRRWLVERGVTSLIVDLPSLDRADGGGRLAAHREFWGLPPGSEDPAQATRGHALVNELAYVPDPVPDGLYLLDLQVPAFGSDAAHAIVPFHGQGMNACFEDCFELERCPPERFIPRYSMVMFHHEIPYRVAFERGRVQAGLLARLTATADSVADVPAAQMDALVTELLDPLPSGC